MSLSSCWGIFSNSQSILLSCVYTCSCINVNFWFEESVKCNIDRVCQWQVFLCVIWNLYVNFANFTAEGTQKLTCFPSFRWLLLTVQAVSLTTPLLTPWTATWSILSYRPYQTNDVWWTSYFQKILSLVSAAVVLSIYLHVAESWQNSGDFWLSAATPTGLGEIQDCWQFFTYLIWCELIVIN